MASSRPFLRWIGAFERAAQAARTRRTSTAVHDLRVNAARIDVGLRAMGLRVLRDDLRRLRRACGPARDLDVLIGRVRRKELRAALGAARASEFAALAKLLDPGHIRALVSALRLVGQPDADELRRWARQERRRAARRAQRAARPDSSIEELHAARRTLRRLRHAHECLGLDARPLKAAQRELGRLHDLAACIERLDELPPSQSRSSLRRALTASLEARILGAREQAGAVAVRLRSLRP